MKNKIIRLLIGILLISCGLLSICVAADINPLTTMDSDLTLFQSPGLTLTSKLKTPAYLILSIFSVIAGVCTIALIFSRNK